MAKTSGPWKLRIGNGETGAEGVGYIEAMPNDERGYDKEVAVLYALDDRAEDAHLIAAAPDLLEACKFALETFKGANDDERIVFLRAIAKAEGQ